MLGPGAGGEHAPGPGRGLDVRRIGGGAACGRPRRREKGRARCGSSSTSTGAARSSSPSRPRPRPGFDQEVLRGFAALHRVTLTPVFVNGWDALIPALLAGKGDVIAGRFTATDTRRKQIDFTTEVFPYRLVVITRKPRPVITTVEELRRERVGTSKGTIMVEVLEAAGGQLQERTPQSIRSFGSGGTFRCEWRRTTSTPRLPEESPSSEVVSEVSGKPIRRPSSSAACGTGQIGDRCSGALRMEPTLPVRRAQAFASGSWKRTGLAGVPTLHRSAAYWAMTFGYWFRSSIHPSR